MVKPENLYLRRNSALTAFAAVLCLAVCGLLVFLAVFINSENIFDDTVDAVIFYAAIAVLCAIMLVYAVLYFINLTRKFVIYTDEKGIYHYSGFVHLGFIPWEEIGEIKCLSHAQRILTNSSSRLIILPRGQQNFFGKLSFLQRYALIAFGASIKVHTLGTRANTEALCAALVQRHDYYTTQI